MIKLIYWKDNGFQTIMFSIMHHVVYDIFLINKFYIIVLQKTFFLEEIAFL